jgi:hypothetical protein
MAIVTLAAILQKVRRLVGSPNPLQILDNDLIDYVDSFYTYDLPAQFRSLKLKDVYTFNTQQGLDVYPFPFNDYTTVTMPCYIAKREVKLFNDAWSFYASNFNWQNFQNFATGNGTAGPYTGILSAIPIIRSANNDPTSLNYPVARVQNVLITANTGTVLPATTLNVTDDGAGNLIGDVAPFPAVSTINYLTGAISVTFSANIPAGQVIQCQYNPVSESIPLAVLFYQSQFTLRPVPDRGYTVEITAYRKPSQALLNTPAQAGVPELNEWWELVAVGAAKKFFEDSLDLEGAAIMDKMLRERYALAETRTYAQLGTERVSTIFADQLQYNYGQSAGWFGSV